MVEHLNIWEQIENVSQVDTTLPYKKYPRMKGFLSDATTGMMTLFASAFQIGPDNNTWLRLMKDHGSGKILNRKRPTVQ